MALSVVPPQKQRVGVQGMSDDQPKRPAISDADLQREIREGRKFSLAEAIGRMAGPGAMKGASPITGKQQAEAEIEHYLNRHLADGPGILPVVLLHEVSESDYLLNHLDQPLVALAGYVQSVLENDYRLQELTRKADVEWGRTFGERPHFETQGRLPHPDDPYTAESVRVAISRLNEKLTAAHQQPPGP
jgi:hypothetical protein